MKIGNVEVENGVLLAPMEDVSDLPFRVVCRRLGADIVYTEFISSEGLVRDARRSLEKLVVADEEHPVSIQIFGGDIPTMIRAAQKAEESQPDFIDINCGCWVKNVVARNAGAALLKDPPLMQEMTRSIVKNVKIPVTVKTRLGWDPSSIVIVEVAKRLEDAGAAALTIHCRTRDQGHSGSAYWEWIEKVKKEVSIPVILNGDVVTSTDVVRAFAETPADAVMIGRAAIGNPFIFKQAKEALRGEEPTIVGVKDRIDICLEHLKITLNYKLERRAVVEFRKHYGGYLKGLYNSSLVRQDLNTFESFSLVEERLHRFVEEVESRSTLQPQTELAELLLA